jgi:hypothetical protein
MIKHSKQLYSYFSYPALTLKKILIYTPSLAKRGKGRFYGLSLSPYYFSECIFKANFLKSPLPPFTKGGKMLVIIRCLGKLSYQ